MMEVAIPILIVLLLVLANGLFVAAEFAIVGAPRASIDHQASQGGRLARRVARVLEDPRRQDRYIATTQIGISVASLGLGMYGEHVLAEWIAARLAALEEYRWIAAHTAASVVAIAVLTYLHIVIGEMVPKALALQRAVNTARYVTPFIQALEFVLYPAVVGLNSIGTGLLRLIGIHRQEVEAERYHTSEELQYIIEESHEGGLLRGESGRILRELFAFGDLTAREVMVPRVQLVGIPVGANVDQLRDIVRRNLHTRYPVYDGDLDHILGSMHIKHVLRHYVLNRPVAAGDARPLPYVPMTTPLDEVITAMRQNRAQMAVVMDEYGGTAGLITFEDLFEEVVGEIDEGRGRRQPVHRAPDGRLIVRGTVRLEELSEALEVPVEHADVVTVSGLILALLQRPAAVGDAVTWSHARFEVAAVAGRGVAEAIVTRVARPAADASQASP
ncbi:MAG TPA: hemolysin family protein [Vicinamibacterales bacterium]|nr:hemolysin family protein [Vicinamibacterales bacterium]